ncbi:MAG: TonB-dependent receptor [Acidobacteria bacterium]|nr:TonB-dependent receptor [Acidobacteriota bacterium]
MFPNRNGHLYLAAVLLLTCLTAFGQTFRGGIAGNVADSSGAAVPGAAVKIQHSGTGLTREQQSASTGDFSFPDLPTGAYTLTVSHQGFQTYKIENLEAAVGKVTNVPVTLGVAQQTELVEVQAAAVSLETSSSALNAVVNNRAVQEIPLNGRDFRQLLYLTPGFNQSASMNGNRSNQNNWQIDGVDNNDFWHNAEAVNQGSISGIAGVLLPIDAIDQFNQQAGGGADFGRNPGSMVNLVLKSGTNDLHGTAYYFHRNDALAQTSPFAPAGASNKIRNHHYGFSVGGPIFKNKTFYFLTWEHQKFIAGNPLQATIPSDPWVTRAEAVLRKYGVGRNPVMTSVLGLWTPKGRGAPATQPNYFSSDNNDYKSDNGVIKVDQVFNSKHNMFVRAFLGTGDATAYAGSPYREYFQVVPSRQHNFSAVLNSVFTPRLVNQVLAGVNYFEQTFDDSDHSANPPSFGFNTGITNPSNYGTPTMDISGFAGVGATPRLGRIDTTGHITDNLSYNYGSHGLKFGGEVRRARLDVFYYREARGGFGWDGTVGPWKGDAAFSQPERALADFLAGYIGPGQATIATGDPQRDYYVNSVEWWAQDNWQVSPRLNLNFGLRWTYNGRMHDEKNSISTFLPTAPGGIAFIGTDVEALYPKDLNNFAPRFGFAYTPRRGGKTVIRGSYGVFYDIVNGNLFIDNRAGSDAGRGVSRNPAGPNPVYSVSNSDTLTVQRGVNIFGGAKPSPPFALYGVNQNLRSPYIQNFNINLQQQLSHNVLLQVGYVGNQARKLVYTHNINQPQPDPTGTVPAVQRRPYGALFPNFRGITEIESGANSQYNSLQASLRNKSWHGVTSQFSYTLAHARDQMSGPRNNRPSNNYNFRGDYGDADFDYRHVFSGYLLYDVPQLGRAAPKLTKGWQLNALFTADSGGPFNVGAGQDISKTLNRNDRVDLVGDPFSGVVQQPHPGGRLTDGVRWFNPAAFKLPAVGTYGSIERNKFHGPGFGAVDFSVFKNTPLTERISSQFRVEIFNLFDRVNLGGPDGSLGSGPGMGLIYGTRHGGDAPGIGFGEPRNVQIALKLIW